MLHQKARQEFEEANQLWFYEGYTSQAVSKYKEALRLSGNDPVIAFQLASALWALGQAEEGLPYLRVMEQHAQALGAEGRRQLAVLKEQIAPGVPEPAAQDRRGEYLDIEKLEQQKLSKGDWFRVALAAERQQLYGVALRAYELSERGFLDTDLLQDEEQVRFQVEQQLALLEDLRSEMS